MPVPNPIDIPPAQDITIPAGQLFTFVVGTSCTACFGTANPAGSFGPNIENQTFQWGAGTTHEFSAPNSFGASLPYNTSASGTPCSPQGFTDIGHVIHIGSGTEVKAPTARKAKKKTAGKKAAAKKSNAARAARSKPKPKKSAAKKSPPKKAKKAARKAPAKSKKRAKPAAKKGKSAKRTKKRR